MRGCFRCVRLPISRLQTQELVMLAITMTADGPRFALLDSMADSQTIETHFQFQRLVASLGERQFDELVAAVNSMLLLTLRASV